MTEGFSDGDARLGENLCHETAKWQEKAEALFSQLSGDERFRENISAYLSDSHYFMEQKDLIRAFEAVIWAWAWIEIGLDMGLLQHRQQKTSGSI